MEIPEFTKLFVAALDGNPELNDQEKAIVKALPYLIDADLDSDPRHFHHESKGLLRKYLHMTSPRARISAPLSVEVLARLSDHFIKEKLEVIRQQTLAEAQKKGVDEYLQVFQKTALKSREGSEIKLGDFFGEDKNYSHVVLIFGGSWCEPCQHEIPFINEAQKKLGKKVQFLGIGLERSFETMVSAYDQLPAGLAPEYPLLFDEGRLFYESVCVKKTGVPYMLVFTSSGKLVDLHMGFSEPAANEENPIMTRLKPLLGPSIEFD